MKAIYIYSIISGYFLMSIFNISIIHIIKKLCLNIIMETTKKKKLLEKKNLILKKNIMLN